MFGGLNRLLVAAGAVGVAVTVALAGPSAALACNGSTSAVNVYTECLPSGGNGGGGGGHSKSSGGDAGASSKSSGAVTTPVKISAPAKKAVKHAGKLGRELQNVVSSAPTGVLRTNPSNLASEPSAVGSAFDLGSGPTALLIALAGAAVALLGASGVRGWRRSRTH